jgi:hypothetical protein
MPNQKILLLIISKGVKATTIDNPVDNAMVSTETSAQINRNMTDQRFQLVVTCKGLDIKAFVIIIAKIRM